MKKTMLALIGGALLLATPACKKGANDPALSLKSRKARLAGEYKVSNLKKTTYSTWSSNPTTYVFDYQGGTSATITTTSGSTSSTETTPISLYEFTFDKKGTWSMNYNYQSLNSYSTGLTDVSETTDHITTRSGTWAFIGKTKDAYKNKERIQLSTLEFTDKWNKTTVTTVSGISSTNKTSGSSSETYSALEYVMIYAIDMLKNKEMVFTYQEDEQSSDTDNSGTTTTNSFTIDETMTLTQK